jgi:AraC family chitin signaling transcriptional activator
MYMTRIFITLFCFIVLSYCSASNYIPTLESYDKTDYKASPQNWSVDYDDYGIVYVGNTQGLLRYIYGVWEFTPTGQHDIIRSLDVDNDTVWCGGDREFGYFTRGNSSDMRYHSIIDVYGEAIWKVRSFKSKVYVRGENVIFIYNKKLKKITEVRFGKGFFDLEIWNNEIWAMARDGSLGVIGDHGFEVKAKYNNLANSEIRELFVLNDKLYGAILDGRLISYDGKAFDQINLPQELKNTSIFSAIGSDNQLFVGTISRGLFCLDAETYELKYVIDNDNGLLDNTVLSLAETPSGKLWLALDYGIIIV